MDNLSEEKKFAVETHFQMLLNVEEIDFKNSPKNQVLLLKSLDSSTLTTKNVGFFAKILGVPEWVDVS